eukprot:TRINITY_DN68303_c0_g1_i1.p1 TRINITY_DN68303_c0_g1~~TRINITY_DN68303_c0_g1_i1.p1  ORF type:complete len:517 (+),score=34.65 TRINITY_DN68303_c0_g1_i1:89-1552(+)
MWAARNQFGIRYCNGHEGRFGWDFNGHSNLLELNLLLHKTVMIRRTKAEVLDELPAKRRQEIHLQVTQKEKREWAKKLEKLRAINLEEILLDDDAPNPNPTTQAGRDKQSIIELYNDSAKYRIPAVTEFIEDLVLTGAKFLVFGHHIDVLDALEKTVMKAVKKYATDNHLGLCDYIRIDGKTKATDRHELVGHFRSSDNCRVAILSIKACGTGLTFTPCSLVVFAELFWTPGIMVQCEDRVHRIGQRNPCMIKYLLARGTADDIMWPMLKRKLDVIRTTVGTDETKEMHMDTEGSAQFHRKTVSGTPTLDNYLHRSGEGGSSEPKTGPMDHFLHKANKTEPPASAGPSYIQPATVSNVVRPPSPKRVTYDDYGGQDVPDHYPVEHRDGDDGAGEHTMGNYSQPGAANTAGYTHEEGTTSQDISSTPPGPPPTTPKRRGILHPNLVPRTAPTRQPNPPAKRQLEEGGDGMAKLDSLKLTIGRKRTKAF